MSFSTKNQQSTKFLHTLTQLDIRSTTRHIGGNGYCTLLTSLCDNLSFFLMKFRIEYRMTDIGTL